MRKEELLELRRKKRELNKKKKDLKSEEYKFRQEVARINDAVKREQKLMEGIDKINNLRKEIEKETLSRIDLSINEINGIKRKRKSIESLKREKEQFDEERKRILAEISQLEQKIKELETESQYK